MQITRRFAISNRVFEYFVVFVVVMVISVFGFIQLNRALAEARDSRRIGDVNTLRSALELYYLDHGGYPKTGWVNSAAASWNDLGTALHQYLPNLPIDPINEQEGPVEQRGSFNYSYYSAQDEEEHYNDYVIVFRLETTPDVNTAAQANIGVVTAKGLITYYEMTGEEGLYSLSSPRVRTP